MIKVSKMADYAVVVLAALARERDPQLNAASLAGRTRLPEPTVAKLLKLLSAAGIVESTRGAGGGYRLARMPQNFSIADIIAAVDGPIALTACVDGSDQKSCGYESSCAVKGRWNNVNRAVRGALEGVTLADMMQPHAPAAGVAA